MAGYLLNVFLKGRKEERKNERTNKFWLYPLLIMKKLNKLEHVSLIKLNNIRNKNSLESKTLPFKTDKYKHLLHMARDNT